MYKIYMYNTWFGDCFRLSKQNTNIYIDFGIHHKCLLGGVDVSNKQYSSDGRMFRDDVHKVIADEIVSNKQPDLLVTHYHLDHLSGLLYMKDNLSYLSPIFNKVYLPDIWNLPENKNIIALLIVEGVMEKYRINEHGCTLLEFVKFLCTSVANVVLLKRGKTFEKDNFITLWPDPDRVVTKANGLIKELGVSEQIIGIAEELIEIMGILISQEITEIRQNGRILERVEELCKRVMEVDSDNSLSKLSEKDEIKLNKFGNDISIVFQNSEANNNNNMLFTGDLGSKYLSVISKNEDGKVSMHEKYKYIKIPHHGTSGTKDSCYFDFSRYKPEIIMFTSGKCGSRSYKISGKYQKDIAEVERKGKSKVYCSNSNWCEMNAPGKFNTCGCGASSTNIVFPNISMEII